MATSTYTSFKLAQATVALREMPDAQSVAVGIWYKVGGRHEEEALHGAAHFIEHMLFKGTPRRTPFQINQEVEGRGGDINAFTSEEVTCYYIRIARKHLACALDVLLDMVQHSTFKKNEVERERGVIQEEIRMYDDQPSVVAQEFLNTRLWPHMALGRPLTGTISSVSKLTRSHLTSFWTRHYTPQNMIITVAGNVTPRELRKALSRSIVERNSDIPATLGMLPPCRQEIHPAYWLKRDTQQVNIAIGGRSYSRLDDRRYAQKILSVIMGESCCSRLFQTLREENGLVYSIHTSAAHFEETGAFYIQAGLEAEHYADAIRLIKKEIKGILRGKLSPAELLRAKDFAIGQLSLNLEGTYNQIMWMGEGIAGYGSIPDPGHWADAIRKVTASQVASVAKDIFGEGKLLSVGVGRGLSKKEFLEHARF